MMNRFVCHYGQNHIILIWELLNPYYFVWIWEYMVLNGCQLINDCNIKLARIDNGSKYYNASTTRGSTNAVVICLVLAHHWNCII